MRARNVASQENDVNIQGVPQTRKRFALDTQVQSPNMATNSEESHNEAAYYSVELYDKAYLRARTLELHGLHLPEKKQFTVNVEPAMFDDQQKYSIDKRLAELEKRLQGAKSREKRSTFRKENLLLIDLERTAALKELVTGEIPVFALKTYKEKGTKRYMEFTLSQAASDDLRDRDQQKRFEAAMKIAFGNYLYWNRVYEETEAKTEKSAFEKHRQELLDDFLRNPLESKGVVYCYVVIDETQADDKKYQLFVGKADGEFTKQIKEHNSSGNRPLFELLLQDKSLWPVEDQHLKKKFKESLPKSPKKNETQDDNDDHVPKLDYEPKVIVITLDFGFPEKFAEVYKGSIDPEDTSAKLEQSYLQYFAAMSPIGLNG